MQHNIAIQYFGTAVLEKEIHLVHYALHLFSLIVYCCDYWQADGFPFQINWVKMIQNGS